MPTEQAERRRKVSTLSAILGEHLDKADLELTDADPERRVRAALLARPKFSIALRLALLIGVVLLVTVAVTVGAWLILSDIERSARFVSAADTLAHELEEARRYEKNYFLYHSDPSLVLTHLDEADRVIADAEVGLRPVVGHEELSKLRSSLAAYRELVNNLVAEAADEGFRDSPDYKVLESDLRDHGASMLDQASIMAEKEREQIFGSIALTRRGMIVLILVLLPLYVYIAAHIYRHILARLTRLTLATQRLADGDFSPILPTRKYKDEFSNLAIALNHMMYELERRHTILVESHKMRAVGNLTAGIAHELNNPLNNIMLTSEMLKEDWSALDDPDRLEMVDELTQQAERARSIVKNLLDFARESDTEVEHLDIKELLDEVVRLAQNQIRISKIKLHVDAGEHLPPAYGDRGLLVQVFLNLILNAIDAMPHGGHLFVRVAEEEDTGFLAIHVQDTGTGIPSHILGSIFDPFFTTKATSKGTGLGLAVCQGIVDQHGGDIEVMSKVGVGTTFTVHLPCVPVPAQVMSKKNAGREDENASREGESARSAEDQTAD